MQITFQISGGFASTPGLNAPRMIDTSTIDPASASELESIIRDVRFFALPTRSDTTNPNAADFLTYAIEIRDGDRVHSILLTDPVSDVGLTRLIDFLRMTKAPSK